MRFKHVPLFLLLISAGAAAASPATADSLAYVSPAALEEYHSDRDFIYLQAQRGDTGQSLLERLLTWVWRKLVAPVFGNVPFRFWHLLLFAGGIVAIYWFIIRYRLGKIGLRNSATVRTAEGGEVMVDPLTFSEMDFAELQIRAQQQGDFRLAMRYAYLRLLQLFNRYNWITYGEHKTDRTYWQELQAHGQQMSAFTTVMQRYAEVWYGEKAAQEEDLKHLERLLDTVSNGPGR
jgi:hypothetical protein